MEIYLKGSTKDISAKEDALAFGRAAARVCYSKYDFDEILHEEDKNDLIGMTLAAGHHSPYEHPQLTFYIKDIPKFGAMILNNERPYVTSEKSARYTKMDLDEQTDELYESWMPVFQEKISEKYPFIPDKKVKKLAQENSRYLTSVFTPAKMLYTVSFRQLNQLMHWFNHYLEDEEDTDFNMRVKDFMRDFNSQLEPFYEHRLDPEMKKRRLKIFSERDSFKEEFGENYSITYDISYAGLAQAQRHRTLDYEIIPESESVLDKVEESFFVPPILRSDPALVDTWLEDMDKVKDDHPQGTLVKVHETGNYEDFISKANERLCGNAQWEVMHQTKKSLEDYIKNTEKNNPEVHAELEAISYGPRCTFPDTSCNEPCAFGPRLGIDRLV